MPLQILFFGPLTDIVGTCATIAFESDTDGLQKKLQAAYPQLAKKQYVLAVDKKIVHQNTPLSDGCTVALLPPFAGG